MQHKDLPEKWKSKIANYLHHNGKEGSELNTDDFALPIINIKFESDSLTGIERALVIDAPEFGEVLIFTEHNEYHIFNSVVTSIDIIDTEEEKDFFIQKLQERHEGLKQFIPKVARDFKSPLRTIESLCRLLKKDSAQFSKKHLDYLDGIIKSCNSAKELIHEDLERCIAPYKRHQLECVDLAAILSDIKKNLARRIEDAQIVVDVPDNFPKILQQKAMLLQFFQNLIFIAIQYKKTDEEEASVSISWEKYNSEYVKIIIKYKGVDIEKGYHEETPDSVFFGFFSGPSFWTNLYVTIRRNNIDQEGEQFWIEPEKGIDTLFLTLKLYT